MKTKILLPSALLLMLFLTNCKKDSALEPTEHAQKLSLSNNSSALSATGVPINSVFTVAGKPYTSGPTLIDGPAETARFNSPSGIQLMADGTIYIADTKNDAIRVLSATGNVTTLPVPNKQIESSVYWLKSPEYVGVDDNGAVHTIDRDQTSKNLRFMVFDKQGLIFGGSGNDYYDERDLAKDPYGNFFWSIDGSTIRRYSVNPSKKIFNYINLVFTNYFLPDDPGYYTYQALFAGYNGVIYFAYKNKIYKHNKNNTGAVAFPNLTFNNITCIIGNKDSRTFYIADNGFIKRIDSGKLTVIAGPNSTNKDSRDGVGFKADVSAKYLALSKDESTIYFSDTRANAIRKIVLR